MKLLRSRALWAAAGTSLSSMLLAWTSGAFDASTQPTTPESGVAKNTTVCTSPTPPDDPGAFAASPGNWFNPNRYGTGWSLNFEGPTTNQRILLFWHTFDQHGAPVWLQSGNANVGTDTAGNRTWSARLFRVRYNYADFTKSEADVGSVSLLFPQGSASHAEVTWQWPAAYGNTPQTECIYDIYRGQLENMPGPGVVNPSYTANWFDPHTPGWGIDINVGQTSGGTRTEHSVFDVYDTAGNPVWLESQSATMTWQPTSWISEPVIVHRGMYAVNTDCTSTDNCRATTLLPSPANRYSRAFDTPNTGSAELKIDTRGQPSVPVVVWPPSSPPSPTPLPYAASWPAAPPAEIPSCPAGDAVCRPIRRLTDTAIVMVGQTTCEVPPGLLTCPINVSWATPQPTDPTTVVSVIRVNALQPTDRRSIATNAWGSRDEDLRAGDRVYFELFVGPHLQSTSPIVTATAAYAPASPPAPQQPATPSEDLASTAVGFTPGELRVDESGNTTYRVPIAVPPGRGDLAPKLAVRYSSGAGDGIAGWGASLEGGGAISRCRYSTEHGDDTNRSMDLEMHTHAFCLDGQRLIRISGSEAAGNAVYRTEVDGIRKVQMVGVESTNMGAGGGATIMQPVMFRVYSKDGTLATYGEGSARRLVYPQGRTAAHYATEWWLSSVQDATRQNKVDYVYNEDVAAADAKARGSIALTSVRWVGGGVRIGYTPRTVANEGYALGGTRLSADRWLEAIRVYSRDDALLRTYTPSYEDLPQNPYLRRLTAIRECAANGACLEPTVFDWYDGATTLQSTQRDDQNFPDVRAFKYGDVNGDGRADVVTLDRSGGLSVSFSTAIPTTPATPANPATDGVFFTPQIAAIPGRFCEPFNGECFTQPGDYYSRTWALIDFNADGRDDLLAYINGQWRVRLSNGNGFNTADAAVLAQSGASVPSVWPRAFIADFDGNGLPDVMTYEDRINGNARAWLMQPTGIAGAPYRFDGPYGVDVAVANPLCNLGSMLKNDSGRSDAIDFNGDGRADFAARSNNADCSGGSPVGGASTADEPKGVIVNPIPPEYVYTFISRGLRNGILEFEKSAAIDNVDPDRSPGSLQIADINGDGNPDLLWRNSTNELRVNLGLGFPGGGFAYASFCARGGEASCPVENDKDVRLLDYDGDGRLDLWRQDADTNNYIVHLWTGNGFASTDTPTPFHGGDNAWLKGFADLDGDGLLDGMIMRSTSDGASWKVQRSTAHHQPRNLVKSVSDGLGGTNTIEYGPLTLSTVYAREYDAPLLASGHGSPVQDVVAPLYVATRIGTSAPAEGDPTAQVYTQYRYAGLKMQAGGRGSLGFRRVYSYANGLQTMTEYHQAFPLTGLPKYTQVRQAAWSAGCTPKPEDCLVYGGWNGIGAVGSKISESTDTWHYRPSIGKDPLPVDPPLVTGARVPIFVYRTRSETIKRDLQYGFMAAEATTFTDYDRYGNLLGSDSRNYTDEAMQTELRRVVTANLYSYENATDWVLGRLTNSTVTTSRPNTADVARSVVFMYMSNGLLSSERIHTGDNASTLVTRHIYDGYGNPTRKIVCGGDSGLLIGCGTFTPANLAFRRSNEVQVQRLSEVEYDGNGLYPTKNVELFAADGVAVDTPGTNRVAVADVTARDGYGTPTATTLVNGARTTAATDGFGRPHFALANSGATTTTTRRWCASTLHPGGIACPVVNGQAIAVYRVHTTVSGAPATWVYYDRLDREVLSVREGFGAGHYVAVRTGYDERARPYYVTEPYFTHSPNTPNVGQANGVGIFATTTQYDKIDRPTSITYPNGATTTILYQGLVTTTTLPANTEGVHETKRQQNNALGEVVAVTDALGSIIETAYDAAGNAVSATRRPHDGPPVTSTAAYDVLGRKIAMSDPDAGTWSFAYNAAGEVVRKWSGTSCTTMRYDARGRVYDRKDYADGACTTLDTTTAWTFDTASNGYGKAKEVSYQEPGAHPYKRTHTYDAFGRESASKVEYAGSSYTQSATFDQFGRPFQTFFAAGAPNENGYVPQSGELFEYNERGYRKIVRDAYPNTTGTIYSEALAYDARGNIVAERQADNPALVVAREFDAATGRLSSISTDYGRVQSLQYGYDEIGNLSSRTDRSGDSNHVESFRYDALQRLTSTQRVNNKTGASETTFSATYDGLGNLHATQSNPSSVRYYDKANDGVCGLPSSTTPGPGAMTRYGTARLCYDARGNMVKDIVQSGGWSVRRALTYTPFDQVREVTTPGFLTPVTGQFVYGPERQRVSYRASGYRTIYIGNTEIRTDGTPRSQREVRRYVGNLVITRTHVATGQTLSTVRQFLLADAQGSTHRIVDGNGDIISNAGAQAFTPFGARAAPATGSILTEVQRQAFDTSATTRGYTGHQQHDGLGLIHMGGRIYDPEFGRFLQADPFVQDPSNTQNLNRYSYVNNNPLSYTDPTGYWGKQQQGYLRQAVAIAIAIWSGGAASANSTWSFFGMKGAAAAVTGGFASGAVATGNLRGAVTGAFSGMVGFRANGLLEASQFARGTAVIAAGGGMVEAMNGGRFGHGFVSAGLGALMAPYLETGNAFATGVVRTIAGGAVAEVTGGKFANGAATAAFSYAFTSVASKIAAQRNGNASYDAPRKSADGIWYTMDIPPGLASIYIKYPELWEKVKATMAASNIWGPNKERGFYAYMPNSGDGPLMFVDMPDPIFRWGWGESWTYGTIPAHTIPMFEGYKLVLSHHTHPFSICFESCSKGQALQGPSAKDAATAGLLPDAYHSIEQLGGFHYYFGARAQSDR